MSFRSKILRDLVTIAEQLNDPNLLIDVIHIFQDQAPIQVKELKSALIKRDIEMIGFLAHKLKTSAGVVGSHHLQSLCLQIESCLPHSLETIDGLMVELQKETEAECARVQTELDEFLRPKG